MRVFAIGDIHGHSETFEALLEKMELQEGDQLFLLGDMINKGPDTMRVLDIILELKVHYKVTCLRGNHEQRFLRKLKNEKIMRTFVGERHRNKLKKKNQGKINHIPPFYKRLIKNTKYYTSWGKFIMVHGGLNFKRVDPLQDKRFMMHGRNWYDKIDYEWLGDRYILHGHNYTTLKNIKKMYKKLEKDRVLNLDSGIVEKKSKGYGRLTALELTKKQLFYVKRV